MKRRTTIEIDDELLARAKTALGCATTRATVEEALRRATELVGEQHAHATLAQSAYLEKLGELADLDVLRSDAMWR